MRIAVTGAGGFVGRHVVAELERRGFQPLCVVRPGTVLPASWSRREIAHVDIHAPAAGIFAALGKPDALIHLAWGGLPNYRALHHFERELPAQYAFLGCLVRDGLPRLVGVGTCFEYGLQSGALTETLESRPANPYGFAKDVLRRQLEFLQASVPFGLTWARLFYVFGDGQAPSSLLSQLRQAAERGDAAFDMSMGEQLRDFLPITEAARCLVEFALSPVSPGVVNVCSGFPISVRRRVELWLQQFGWGMQLNLGRYPYPDYEPLAFWGDSTRLQAFLAARGLPPTAH